MKRRTAAVLLVLALILAVSASADSTWECSACHRRLPTALGDTCPYCGAQRHVHTWREATCTEPKTCLVCGATEGTAPGHQWDEGIVIHEATCRTIGAKRYTCTVCGTTRDDVVEKNPANHDGGTEVRGKANAACTEDGYTGDLYCAGCGELISKGVSIPALGHQWDAGAVIQEASCRQIGAKRYTCSACGETKDEITPVDPARHDGGTEKRFRKEATAVEEGYTGDVYCKGCGKLIAKGSRTEPTGYQEGAGQNTGSSGDAASKPNSEPTSAPAPEPYRFADPVAERVIRDELNMPNGPLTKDDLRNVKYLYNESIMEGAGIRTLEDFRFCTDLRGLWLRDNPVADLSPIADLPLEKLDIKGTNITDLSPIANMTTLVALHLNHSKVSDLSPISGLYNLKRLYIDNSGIRDLSPIMDIDLELLQVKKGIKYPKLSAYQKAHPGCKVKKSK